MARRRRRRGRGPLGLPAAPPVGQQAFNFGDARRPPKSRGKGLGGVGASSAGRKTKVHLGRKPKQKTLPFGRAKRQQRIGQARSSVRRQLSRRPPSGLARRAGGVVGKPAGSAAAGFVSGAGKSYRAARPKGASVLSRAARSKNAKYAAVGLGGAVAARGAYGLAKARLGRSQHITQVNVSVQAGGGKRSRRQRRKDRRRRDRYGRFR